jgi:sugar O-acyltransferase (sialic acid O-acetyltransferase NeuD family)
LIKKLAILGASFFDVIKLAEAINRNKPTWDLIGFIDDKKELQGTMFGGYPVLAGREIIPDLVRDDVHFVNNVAGSWQRIKLGADILESFGCKMANLIHPAIDMNHAEIGYGCILPEGCIIGGQTRLGNHVIARLRVLISHNVTVEDYVFIGPGAVIGGNALIKRGAYIGAAATIMQKKTVGAGAIVGAGAVVISDVEPGTTVAGVPAKKIEKKKYAALDSEAEA